MADAAARAAARRPAPASKATRNAGRAAVAASTRFDARVPKLQLGGEWRHIYILSNYDVRGWPRIARMRPARLSVREASELPDVGAETGGERAWGIVNMPLPAGVEPYTAAQRQEAAKLAPAGGSPKLQLGVVHNTLDKSVSDPL